MKTAIGEVRVYEPNPGWFVVYLSPMPYVAGFHRIDIENGLITKGIGSLYADWEDVEQVFEREDELTAREVPAHVKKAITRYIQGGCALEALSTLRNVLEDDRRMLASILPKKVIDPPDCPDRYPGDAIADKISDYLRGVWEEHRACLFAWISGDIWPPEPVPLSDLGQRVIDALDDRPELREEIRAYFLRDGGAA